MDQENHFFLINITKCYAKTYIFLLSIATSPLELMYAEHRVTFYYFQDILAKSNKFCVMAEDINL